MTGVCGNEKIIPRWCMYRGVEGDRGRVVQETSRMQSRGEKQGGGKVEIGERVDQKQSTEKTIQRELSFKNRRGGPGSDSFRAIKASSLT